MQINSWEIIKSLWTVLKIMWPVYIIAGVLIFVRIFFDKLDLEIDNWHVRKKFKRGEEWRSDRDLLQWLRGMRPKEFEEYIADLFSRLGYKTQAVGKSHDGGIDVIAGKDSIEHYIQCKKFIRSQVMVHDVRDFYGALADKLSNSKGYFITTNKFTLEAEKFAEDKPIELIDGQKLIEYIHLAKKGINTSQLSSLGKCPKCGGNLIERKGKFGKFYGCSNYPKCHFTKKL